MISKGQLSEVLYKLQTRMSIFHRSLLLHSGLALLCIYRCNCIYITIVWVGQFSECSLKCKRNSTNKLGDCSPADTGQWPCGMSSDFRICHTVCRLSLPGYFSVLRLQCFSINLSLPRKHSFIWNLLAKSSVAYRNLFLNVTDYLPCYLIFKRMVSVLVVVMVKGLGILREFSKMSESEAVDVNVLVFTIEETADCVFISANI